MGYNTTLIVLNDALEEIKGDPEFGKKVAEAISRIVISEGRIDISAGNHCNAASVVESHHADISRLVLLGGNLGRPIDGVSFSWRTDPETEEGRKDIMERLGAAWGFSVKKEKEVA